MWKKACSKSSVDMKILKRLSELFGVESVALNLPDEIADKIIDVIQLKKYYSLDSKESKFEKCLYECLLERR